MICLLFAKTCSFKTRLINGKELTTKDGVQIEKDVNNNRYALVIPKANPTVHAGQITIKAANNIATATHELTLHILGKSNFRKLIIKPPCIKMFIVY